MKTLAVSILAIAAMALIAVQHQQLGHLRAETASLQQASAEAEQLKVDIAKSTDAEANAEDEIARLREENRDLLKLRSQVQQLRDVTAQLEKVRAENLRLQSVARNASSRDAKQNTYQPIVVHIQNLSFQGLATPEAAVQTFLWADRNGNIETLSNCILPERWPVIRDQYQNVKRYHQGINSGATV